MNSNIIILIISSLCQIFLLLTMTSCAASLPQLHSHHGLASHPAGAHHDGFHQHDGLGQHPVSIVHPGVHEHDGVAAHPVATAHRGFHEHDGLPPHPVGSHAHGQFLRRG